MGSLCKRGATAKATSQRAAKRAKDAAAAAAAAATAASTALPQAAVAPEPVPLAPEQAPAALVPAPASPESASLEPARHDVMHEAASLHHAAAGAVNELGVLAEQLAAFIVQRETTELSCEKGIDMDMSVLEESLASQKRPGPRGSKRRESKRHYVPNRLGNTPDCARSRDAGSGGSRAWRPRHRSGCPTPRVEADCGVLGAPRAIQGRSAS